MPAKTYTVEVQPDFIERQAKAKPCQAVAELIWNGLDADATTVDVRIDRGELGMTRIVVRDNGHGIAYQDAPDLFTHLGGSWEKRVHARKPMAECSMAMKAGAASRLLLLAA